MEVLVKTSPENPGIFRPQLENDVGYDLIAASEPKIVGHKADIKEVEGVWYHSIDYISYDIEVSFAPESNIFAFVFPRSSLSKYNLSLCNSAGVIDPGYRNTISARFNYLFQPIDMISENGSIYGSIDENKIYQKGDKIGQVVWAPNIHPILRFVDNLPPSERMFGGFGSTGN